MYKPRQQDGKSAESAIKPRLWAAAAVLAVSVSVFSSGSSGADFNRDTKADIAWRNTVTGAVSVWMADAGNIIATTQMGVVAGDWVIQGTGDFNGDATTDILWRQTSSGLTAIWLMSDGVFQSYAGGWAVTSDWVVQGIGDFDGNGRSDILWRQSSTGAVSIWSMSGGTVSTQLALGAVLTDWVIQGVGDFNGDGRSDILWRQASSGVTATWLMGSTGVPTYAGGWSAEKGWVVQGVGDFDGDAKSDILWRHSGTGATAVWLMNGGSFPLSSEGWSVPADWVIHGVGDFSGDRKADILWRQTSTGLTAVWLMNGGTFVAYVGGWSVATDWVIQPPLPVPASPTALAAAPATASSVNLTWQDNSTNETGFEVERSPNGSNSWTLVATTGADVTAYQDTGLSAATTYYYRVKAKNGGGKSGNSNTANATTSGVPPSAPTSAAATAQSASSISVSWQDTSSNETGFRIERSATGTGGWTEITTVGANVTNYQNTGLAASTAYFYRVRAYNASGNSNYSNTANATTQSATASVTLAWDDNATTESGFRIERSPNGTGSWTEVGTTGANVTTYQNTGLTRGATYYYRVRAYTATEFSSYSNTLQVNVP